MQTKNLSVSLEIKSVTGRRFEGYGSVFGNRDHGGDIIVPGAFASTLKEHKSAGTMPLMFWMHQQDQVPGVWTKMAEDGNGLHVEGELVDTALGRDVRTLLEKKAVRGLSIGYVPGDVGYDRDGNRLLKQVVLREVSIVSMAMNPLARIEAMKARLSGDGEYVPTKLEFEEHFRKFGCSRSVSKSLTWRLFGGDLDESAMPGSPLRNAGEVYEEEKVIEDLLVTFLKNRVPSRPTRPLDMRSAIRNLKV